MESTPKIFFKNVRPQLAEAIKQSCYKFDARYYNIANKTQNIDSVGVAPEFESIHSLVLIIERMIKEAISLDCDVSVIVKGTLIGSFRSTPFVEQLTHSTIRLVIKAILQSIFKCKGNAKETVEGLLAGALNIADEFKLDKEETLKITNENIISSAKEINAKFASEVELLLPA